MHVIRLRGPWQKHPLDGEETIRVAVPELEDHLAGEPSSSGATYQRNFNLPTGLGPDDRVLLRVSEWCGTLQAISVNEHSLTPSNAPLEIDITTLLAAHNRVVLQIAADSRSNARLSGEVTLAIDAS